MESYRRHRSHRLGSNHVGPLFSVAVWVVVVTGTTVFSTGCTSCISKSELARINANLGDLAIVPEPYRCDTDYKPTVGDPLSGFGKGAGEGALKGAGMGLMLAAEDAEVDDSLFGLVLVVFVAGGVVVGGTVGGTVGAFQAVPEDVALSIERFSDNFFDDNNINDVIAHEIYINSLRTRGDLNPSVIQKTIPSDGKDDDDLRAAFYQRLKKEGKETILHIKTTHLAFEGGQGKTPSFALHIQVHTELVSVADGHIIFGKKYGSASPEYPWKSWTKDKGSLLDMEFNIACRELGKQIYTEQIEMPAHCRLQSR